MARGRLGRRARVRAPRDHAGQGAARRRRGRCAGRSVEHARGTAPARQADARHRFGQHRLPPATDRLQRGRGRAGHSVAGTAARGVRLARSRTADRVIPAQGSSAAVRAPAACDQARLPAVAAARVGRRPADAGGPQGHRATERVGSGPCGDCRRHRAAARCGCARGGSQRRRAGAGDRRESPLGRTQGDPARQCSGPASAGRAAARLGAVDRTRDRCTGRRADGGREHGRWISRRREAASRRPRCARDARAAAQGLSAVEPRARVRHGRSGRHCPGTCRRPRP